MFASGLEAATQNGHGLKSPSDRWDCQFKYRILLNSDTGEVLPMDCKRWSCIEHGPLLAWRWRQRVSGVPWALMLTLSLVPEDRGQARKAWTEMVRWLKARGMTTYMRVMELGSEHGMRHWHVLVDARWIDQKELSEQCLKTGLGSVVWVSKVKERDAAIWYLLGYVFKSLGTNDPRQEGWRKLTVSRNIPSWERTLAARANAQDPHDGRWGIYTYVPEDGNIREVHTGKVVTGLDVRGYGEQLGSSAEPLNLSSGGDGQDHAGEAGQTAQGRPEPQG